MILPGYEASEEYLDRALRSIPLGAQTFSKSFTQFPRGVSPYFAAKGNGCRLRDIDGNDYVDFISGLGAITLGYCDPDVDAAVIRQLSDGVIFSLSHPLETEVAERIIELVPCAERVRFGKNGSDATSGAIRAARAFTGRDHILVCGYHGWQDWYIGATARNRGVPQATRDLTHPFPFNDIDSLGDLFARYPDAIAAVVMEPMNVTWPAAGFLQEVRALTKKNGALLIFDETVTGFRFANGGAQALFDVTPDLATFGKGLANGFPLSAVAGRADIMAEFEEVFFSFTMGGECLSLAAARAVLDKLKREPILATTAERGTVLQKGVAERIEKHRIGSIVSVTGHPSWSFLVFQDAGDISSWEIKTLWMQEMMARGFLSLGTHTLSFSHGAGEITQLLAAYDEIFPIIAESIETNDVARRLRCEPLRPLFRVR